jgi:hypothetical protein
MVPGSLARNGWCAVAGATVIPDARAAVNTAVPLRSRLLTPHILSTGTRFPWSPLRCPDGIARRSDTVGELPTESEYAEEASFWSYTV